MTEKQKQLSDDMKYLRQQYGWTDADVVEIRQAASENPAWWDYWQKLATAWRAADNAGQLWQDMALNAVRVYAETHETFLTEQARIEAREAGLPDATDGRAWGAVMQKARREKIVEQIGFARAKSSNLSPKPLWKSLICEVAQ